MSDMNKPSRADLLIDMQRRILSDTDSVADVLFVLLECLIEDEQAATHIVNPSED